MLNCDLQELFLFLSQYLTQTSGHLRPLAPPPYLYISLVIVEVVLVRGLVRVTDSIQELNGQSPTERLRDKRVLEGQKHESSL